MRPGSSPGFPTILSYYVSLYGLGSLDQGGNATSGTVRPNNGPVVELEIHIEFKPLRLIGLRVRVSPGLPN